MRGVACHWLQKWEGDCVRSSPSPRTGGFQMAQQWDEQPAGLDTRTDIKIQKFLEGVGFFLRFHYLFNKCSNVDYTSLHHISRGLAFNLQPGPGLLQGLLLRGSSDSDWNEKLRPYFILGPPSADVSTLFSVDSTLQGSQY